MPDGTPEAGFGTDGIGRFPSSEGYIALGAALLADGAVVLAGSRQESQDNTAEAAALFKMTAAGTPDAAFGTDGIAEFESTIGATALVAVRETAGGGLASGGTYSSDTEAGVLSARFTASGALDETFGTDGVVRSPSERGLIAFAGQYAPDGTLYLSGGISAGIFDVEAAVARVLGDGNLDASFGTEGVAALDVSQPFALTLGTATDARGRIVGTGAGIDFATRASEAFVFRLLPDGSPDPDFASGGVFRTTAGEPLAQGAGIAVQSNGAIVYGGLSGSEAQPRPFVGRLEDGGAPDPSFGTDGFAQAPLDGPALGSRLALQPDGKILIAGQLGDGNTDPSGILLARFLGGGVTIAREPGAESGPLALSLAGPNPFARGTALAVEATQPLAARVSAYDALGREVAVLHDGPLAPGRTVLAFDAGSLAPGAYLVRASTGSTSVTLGVVRR